ncbi:MAG TPA: PAS domain S-box protein [Gaiellaceae bacterium]|nr:PAS domain S-box protein [Gaiellaceae bacterium]
MANTGAHELVQKSLVGEALEHGPMAIFVADENGRYIAVNAYACKLLGYTRDELLGLHLSEVAVNPGALEDFDEMRRNRRRAGTTVLRHRDGSELAMNFRASETTVGGMPLYIGICWLDDD